MYVTRVIFCESINRQIQNRETQLFACVTGLYLVTLTPICLRSLTARGGKYSSQCSALAKLAISWSLRPRDLIMSHWKVDDPDLATALL